MVRSFVRRAQLSLGALVVVDKIGSPRPDHNGLAPAELWRAPESDEASSFCLPACQRLSDWPALSGGRVERRDNTMRPFSLLSADSSSSLSGPTQHKNHTRDPPTRPGGLRTRRITIAGYGARATVSKCATRFDETMGCFFPSDTCARMCITMMKATRLTFWIWTRFRSAL